jgi:hypothetical protein
MKARLIYLTLLAVMFLSVNSYSQVKLGLGVEAGLNLANANITPTVTTSGKTGFIIGSFLDINFSRNFSVAPGLRFITKGYVQNFTDANGNAITETVSFNYIEIPVLLRVEFPLTEVKPYLFAGPTLAINLAATADDVGGGTSTSTDVSTNISGTDFGLLFGGGVGFKIAPKIDLFASFGYELGLSNILKNNTNSTIKNTGIQLTAGAMFHL